MSKTYIRTRDGSCPGYVFHPGGRGPYPAVLVFMDGLGIRPAMLEIGQRLAENGYFTLLPDLFYRPDPHEPMDPRAIFSDPEMRKILMEKFFTLATPANVMSGTHQRAALAEHAGAVRCQTQTLSANSTCPENLHRSSQPSALRDPMAASTDQAVGALL